MASQHNAASPGPLPPPPPGWQPPPRRNKRNVGKAIAAIVVLLLLIYILFFTPVGNMMLSGITGNSYAKSSTFILERVITLEMNRDISYFCDIPIPAAVSFSGVNAQTITGTTISPSGEQIEKHGGNWIQWEGTESGSVTLRIKTHATVHTMVWDIDKKNSGMISDIPPALFASQLNDEWEIVDDNGVSTGEYKIWPSHQSIRNLAKALTHEDLTAYENTKQIYDYIRQNIEYQTVPGIGAKSCLETLRDGRGDCDDQSILLISLLRSVGIPSWLAFGTLYDGVRGEWGAHAWAELYLPVRGAAGETVVIDAANDEFLVRNCNRLEEWKSDGNGGHLSDYYNLLSYNYTSLPNQPAPRVTISDSYSGEYVASTERVYATFSITAPLCIATFCRVVPLPSSQKGY